MFKKFPRRWVKYSVSRICVLQRLAKTGKTFNVVLVHCLAQTRKILVFVVGLYCFCRGYPVLDMVVVGSYRHIECKWLHFWTDEEFRPYGPGAGHNG